METLKITKADLNERNEYTRSRDLEFEGHIEIEASLGWVKILGLIRAGGGLSIKAGSSIEAGWSIEAGSSIKAGWSIEAGLSFEAGWSIKAGESIKAGWSIKAGESIEAGWSIKAGESIEAGWSIRCKAKLTVKLRIFAGLCTWRLPKPEELVIECAELTEGTVCFGDLKLLPAKTEAA